MCVMKDEVGVSNLIYICVCWNQLTNRRRRVDEYCLNDRKVRGTDLVPRSPDGSDDARGYGWCYIVP
jgi:hypothetical protein